MANNIRKIIGFFIPALLFLVTISFYFLTYNSVCVKSTLLYIGTLTILCLWGAELIIERDISDTELSTERHRLYYPFISYLIIMWGSFSLSSYKSAGLPELFCYSAYIILAVIIIRDFTEKSLNNIREAIVYSIVITYLYGMVQFVDTLKLTEKLDPFTWGHGGRIWSCFANSNFFGDFLVITLPIIAAQWLKKRETFYKVLFCSGVLCLWGTASKGALMAGTISGAIFYGAYLWYFSTIGKNNLKRCFYAVGIVGLLCVSTIFYYAIKNPTTMTFRVQVWKSCVELIKANPIIGTGPGSFKAMYPTVKTTESFHINTIHNSLTEHAENEHIEQLVDNGVLGLLAYLWIIFATISIGFKYLKESGKTNLRYDMLGYVVAFMGMLIHNFSDVSMRFVSSGIFFGILPGVIISIANKDLWKERPGIIEDGCEPSKSMENINTSVFFFVLMCIIYLAVLMTSQFKVIQGSFTNLDVSNEYLWIFTWMAFVIVLATICASFIYLLYKSPEKHKPMFSIMVFMVLFPIYYAWCLFCADAYLTAGITLSRMAQWEKSIVLYKRAIQLNPNLTMALYFMGNSYADKFTSITAKGKPEWDNRDFYSAINAYSKTREIMPWYVQVNHNEGVLHLKQYDHLKSIGDKKGAAHELDEAVYWFKEYKKQDPVYSINYYRLAQAYIAKGDYRAAEREYLENINAPRCNGHKHETKEGRMFLKLIQKTNGFKIESML